MPRTIILPDINNLASAVAEATVTWINEHPGGLVCLAAGNTPLLAYQRLIELQDEGKVNLSSVYYAGLDEWVGLGPKDTGSCAQVMTDRFYGPAKIPADHMHVFSGLSNPQQELNAMDQWIFERGGIGFTLLGVGLNGHIGFNEPAAPDQDGCILVDLDHVTQVVSKKYFGRPREISQGISISARTLMKAKTIFLMASGELKREIVSKICQDNPDPAIPAARLIGHPGLTIYLDFDAAADIQP